MRRVLVVLTTACAISGVAWANTGGGSDSASDSAGPRATELTFTQHKHRSETRLEHTVYVAGKASVNDPPNILFDTTNDGEADYKFRHARGRNEVVRLFGGRRSKPATVTRLLDTAISIRFQEGAIGTPRSYEYFVSYAKRGKLLDRVPDKTWIFHNLEVHDRTR